MPNQYKTSQVAAIIGVHPNTVRLYEECEFISKPRRLQNGYRVFTDLHIMQFKMARTALQVEVLQSGLRKQIITIIKLAAQCQFDDAIDATLRYIQKVEEEKQHAEEAISIAKGIIYGTNEKLGKIYLDRRQVSQYLDITVDTLRNWELNGLVHVQKKKNGYCIYSQDTIQQLKIIRSLRCANYSLSAILRMLIVLSNNPEVDIRTVINTPRENEDIVTVCDRLLTSLSSATLNAQHMLSQLQEMKKSVNE